MQVDYQTTCPYCGECIDLLLDCSTTYQQYYEDCSVCCRPMLITLEATPEAELVDCRVQREDDAV